jgi:hypothetical protein
MAAASAGDAGALASDPPDAGARAARPLPAEPKPATGQTDCTRNAICRAEDQEMPAWPLPAPFERCRPSLGKPAAAFSVRETSTARASDPAACCYVEFTACNRRHGPTSVSVPGRPLRDAEAAPIVALACRRHDWTETARGVVPDRARAARWTEDARFEHASVASFARLTLHLLALGAPSELVEASVLAGLDEVRHARLSFGIASAYAAEGIGPGALETLHDGAPTFEGLALATFADGCVNETLAAAGARRRAEDERDPGVGAVLLEIADDEERHAELAWRTLAWAIERGGAPVVDALQSARRRALDDVPDDPRAQRIFGEVILPCLDAVMRRSS